MEKVKKLKLFYSLGNAQGISFMVNTRTSTFALTLVASIVPASALSHIPAIETSGSTLEVDQFLEAISILTLGESIPPLFSTKRVWDED